MYKQYIRGTLEYCSVAFSSSMTVQQSASLERCQAVALRIILDESYISYSAALEMCGLDLLESRRLARCLQYSLKCIDHPQNARFFPLNPNLFGEQQVRNRERYKVNFSRTKQYQESTIPFCQRLLNNYDAEQQKERMERGEGEERKEGEEGEDGEEGG